MMRFLGTLAAFGGLVPYLVGVGSSKVEPRAGNALWVLQDIYEGKTFFDEWNFWNYPDPTHGQVEYVDRDTAMGKLAYVSDSGQAMMQIDNWSNVGPTDKRQSVRIHSKKKYNKGLFILDVEHAPYGCAVWPAWWTSGEAWPGDGEIDIIENVQNSSYNQVAWHTLPGCKLVTPGNFTGEITPNTDCDSNVNYNAGCSVKDASRSSYGEIFRKYKGGVYAMRWTSESIDVWFFYRNTIPNDIVRFIPDPSGWGPPSASLSAQGCDIDKYFKDQMMIFDITLCGDWGTASFGAAGCPGSCADYVTQGKNFESAFWTVNYIRVYQDQHLVGHIVSPANPQSAFAPSTQILSLLALILVSVFSLLL